MLLPTHEEHLHSQFQVSNSKTLACRPWTPAPPGARRQTTRMGLHMKILTTVKKGYAPTARERV